MSSSEHDPWPPYWPHVPATLPPRFARGDRVRTRMGRATVPAAIKERLRKARKFEIEGGGGVKYTVTVTKDSSQ